MRRAAAGRRGLVVLAALALAGVGLARVHGSDASLLATEDHAQTIAAVPDYTAPSASPVAIVKSEGGLGGYVHRGGTYYVYANATDTGHPASGVNTVAADVHTVTAGETAVPLAAGSFTVGGTTYNRRSAQLTADPALAAGPLAFPLTSADVAGNSRTQTGFGVTVDNTVPATTDIQAVNGPGGTVAKPDKGDIVTFTFSEAIDPYSVMANWNGTSANVVVRLTDRPDKGAIDYMTIWDATNTTMLNLGLVDTGTNSFIANGGEAQFGLTGTPSTMVRTGSTVVITLGSPSGTAAQAEKKAGAMGWQPVSTTAPAPVTQPATDPAGNPLPNTLTPETGAADKEF